MQCPLKQTSCTFCNSWMHQLLCSKRSSENPSNTPCCRTACRPDSPWWWGHLQGQGHLQDNLEAVSWASYWVRWQVLHTLRPCIKKHMHWHATRTQGKLFACQHNTGLWPMTMILKPGGANWPWNLTSVLQIVLPMRAALQVTKRVAADVSWADILHNNCRHKNKKRQEQLASHAGCQLNAGVQKKWCAQHHTKVPRAISLKIYHS